MSAIRLSMRKIKEILRLRHACGLSEREIARSCGIARSSVGGYLGRARVAGLSWPLPPGLDETALEQLLFPPTPASNVPRPLPDWAGVHAELKRPGVTRFLLWQEYRAVTPDGLQYSAFCEGYRDWSRTLDLSLRQDYRAGETVLADYAGQTVAVHDPRGGPPREAQVFIAVLGASSYTFAEATWTQQLPDWTASHARAFAFFGGVPETEIIDNLKSGVSRACRYEPELNPAFAELAAHYGVAVLPARVRRPRDKAKAEAAVLLVERWILARLRDRTFLGLAELNAAIAVLLKALNEAPFQKLEGSRRSLFETLDRPALRPLPAVPYEYAAWKKVRVGVDYHVEVGGHYYSVPHALAGRQLDARLAATTIEVFHKGQRVASHRRSDAKGRHTTVRDHMPPAHQRYLEWTPERILAWAEKTGPLTRQLSEAIMRTRTHPQQGFRAALGLLRLAREHGPERLEAACARALALRAHSYRSVASILQHRLDQQPLPATGPPDTTTVPAAHENLRGRDYYQ